jgi:tetratricopeptide (TPR) repeat protein
LLLVAAFVVLFAAPALEGQSTPAQNPPSQPAPAPKDDNPFPGDAPQAPASQSQPGQAQPGQAPASQQAAPQTARPGSDNPFPGEDTNVPIIPTPGTPGADTASGGNGSGDAGRTPRRDFDPDGDPVRIPDPLGNFTATDDTFSSSRSGLKQLPADEPIDARAGKSSKTREQMVKEDIDVGSFYLDKKDWKGAKSRFADAFGLDAENPDALWGLAESERHLQLYADAADHYKLFLSYEPDGKRVREARKGLEEAEAAKRAASNGSK